MRAFAIESYGEADVLQEFNLPLPEITDEEVLIEVENTEFREITDERVSLSAFTKAKNLK